jgi:GntR family transcriptional regulator
VAHVTLIGQTTARATKQEQQKLQLSATDLVMRTLLVRYSGDQPAVFEKTVLPLACLPRIARDGPVVLDLFDLAKEHGLTLGQARERPRRVRAGAQVASHLQIKPGTPLTKLDRVTFTTDGTPIEWRVSFSLLDD